MPRASTRSTRSTKEAPVLAGVLKLAIPGFQPATLNELLRGWRQAAKLKKRDRRVIGMYAMIAGIPKATGKRRVTLTIILGPRQRGADVDAWWKSTLDALKHCGAITDDDRHGVELAPVRYERGPERGTVIELEDVDQSN